jgi:hypothetical protein
MSIGNLTDYGNKGNNFPWQLKMLQGITSMINSLTGVTAGASRTTNILRPANASGTITAGKRSASFSNVGTTNATIKGVTLKPGETVNFDAGAINNTLDAIAYDATGSELLIIYIS